MGVDCPTWCEQDHDESVHPDDQFHSVGVQVPVVGMVRGATDLFTEPASFDVVLFQYAQVGGGPASVAGEEWVFLGGDESGFTVTRESARRLYRALGHVLAVSAN